MVVFRFIFSIHEMLYKLRYYIWLASTVRKIAWKEQMCILTNELMSFLIHSVAVQIAFRACFHDRKAVHSQEVEVVKSLGQIGAVWRSIQGQVVITCSKLLIQVSKNTA